MKILITGGRNYGQKQEVWGDETVWFDNPVEIAYFNDTLDAIHRRKPITCIVHGGAKGADTLAKLWAQDNNVEQKEYLPDWNRHGVYAGPLRNAEMMDLNKDLQCVIAFPGGKGTKNCIGQAKTRKINVLKC